jgi:DNA-binding response OmpR family regulator
MPEIPPEQTLPGIRPPTGARALRVLVVDDDRDLVLTLMALIRLEGHDVRAVYKGTDVPRLLEEFDPDAALLDITLPDASGYEIARRLRARYGYKGITLIAITAWKQHSDVLLAKLVGFDHHFAKPFVPHFLLDVLSALKPRAA